MEKEVFVVAEVYYQSPTVEVIEVEVEKGFATSETIGGRDSFGWDEDEI